MKKLLATLVNIANSMEIIIAVFLFVVIALNIVELGLSTAGSPITIFTMDFKDILSASFSLVIGVEFTKMLCKHTPETVIDVLVFALARHTVIYYERTIDLLIGVLAIAGLFAAKKYFIPILVKPKEEAPHD
jgi:hypothetical protein